MEKPYFAKFIPIDGQVKEGDMYQLLSVGLRGMEGYPKWGNPKKFVGDNHDKLSRLTPPGHIRKVKLFLCSRDIQVGDNVKERLTTGEWMDWHVYNENDLDYDNQIKILGEISPNATWVGEDRMFTAEEVRFVHRSKVTGEPLTMNPLWEIDSVADRMRKEFYIAVKCPNCNQFH
jgi:hypothetical protein